ncbi:hypothetical protein GQX74_007940 [Glossina fuscipes]|nr:hypothetical protein GQX74_007940 [Glossina fuscipes]
MAALEHMYMIRILTLDFYWKNFICASSLFMYLYAVSLRLFFCFITVLVVFVATVVAAAAAAAAAAATAVVARIAMHLPIFVSFCTRRRYKISCYVVAIRPLVAKRQRRSECFLEDMIIPPSKTSNSKTYEHEEHKNSRNNRLKHIKKLYLLEIKSWIHLSLKTRWSVGWLIWNPQLDAVSQSHNIMNTSCSQSSFASISTFNLCKVINGACTKRSATTAIYMNALL